jgi:hypothetical protein
MMSLKSWRFLVLILAALTVGMKFAHVLELAPKLAWDDPELYLSVQTSLYRVFGTLGPVIDVATILGAFLLAYLLRRHNAFRLTLASAAAFTLSLLVWLLIVAPANPHFTDWTTSGVVPADWAAWRAQWQYGQVGSFVFDLVGFSVLLFSVIRETPDTKPST